MATIIDNLNTIVGIKEDIRNAIADKGVDMVDVPFSEFPDKITAIETGSGDGDYQTGYEDGKNFQKELMESITITENGTYTREDGYNEVVVNVENTGLTKIDVAELGLKLAYSTFTEVPEIFDFSNVTDMELMFANCENLITIAELDTSNVNDMDLMFYRCSNLQTIPELDTNSVTDMNGMFAYCHKLQTIAELNTSYVIGMNEMFYDATKLSSLPALNVEKVTAIDRYFGIGNLENLTDVGGWIGLKINWNDNYGLVKCPNLTYQSCINILNGLADVTELGGRTLKVHQNFINLVGDEISIGTNKGWIISA